MATITIKNIPPELYERLKRSAAQHRRSINSEVIVVLEDALRSRPFDPAAFLKSVRELRNRIDLYVTDEEVRAAINEGRL